MTDSLNRSKKSRATLIHIRENARVQNIHSSNTTKKRSEIDFYAHVDRHKVIYYILVGIGKHHTKVSIANIFNFLHYDSERDIPQNGLI